MKNPLDSPFLEKILKILTIFLGGFIFGHLLFIIATWLLGG